MSRLTRMFRRLHYVLMDKMESDTRKAPEQRVTELEGSLVSEMIPAFLEYIRVEEGRVPVTIIRYQAHLDRFIREVGDCAVSEITPDKIAIYKRKLLDSRLAPATMTALLSCIRSFLRYLRDVRQVRVMDAEKIKRIRIPNRAVDFLTKEEVDRMLAAIPGETWGGRRDKALVELLFSSGMRISEVLSLDRDKIDWERNQARVVGKGNKERTVYFSGAAKAALLTYLACRQDDERALFITNGDEPRRLQPHGSWKRFRRYAELAGIGKRVYPHMLRHTMATTLLENGCPIGHIRALLGHAHLATTCKYYLGMMSEVDVKAAHAKYLHRERRDPDR